VQGIDFVISSENSEKLGVGAPLIEYHGTIGMAKELAMVRVCGRH
jgi:phage anti-repressor protein